MRAFPLLSAPEPKSNKAKARGSVGDSFQATTDKAFLRATMSHREKGRLATHLCFCGVQKEKKELTKAEVVEGTDRSWDSHHPNPLPLCSVARCLYINKIRMRFRLGWLRGTLVSVC